jgi:hypothetical protein
VSRFWLALDQGMVMAALGNELAGDRLQWYFSQGAVERAVRPLLAREESPPAADTCLDCPEGVVFARREPHGRRST